MNAGGVWNCGPARCMAGRGRSDRHRGRMRKLCKTGCENDYRLDVRLRGCIDCECSGARVSDVLGRLECTVCGGPLAPPRPPAHAPPAASTASSSPHSRHGPTALVCRPGARTSRFFVRSGQTPGRVQGDSTGNAAQAEPTRPKPLDRSDRIELPLQKYYQV